MIVEEYLETENNEFSDTYDKLKAKKDY